MFDFSAAYKAAKQDKNALIEVLQMIGNYQFNGDICTNSSLKIRERANGTGWFCTDFGNSQIPQIPNLKHDIQGIMFACYAGDKAQQEQILTRLGYGNFHTNTHPNKAVHHPQSPTQNPVHHPQSPTQPTPTNPPANPTNQKKVEKKQVRIPETYLWGSAIGAELLGYFEQKLTFYGVRSYLEQYLTGYGIKPAFPTKCANAYLIAYNGAVKLKSVNPEKGRAKAYRLQDSETYLFGSHLLPTQPTCSDVLIFVEGETDVLCANLHFNQFGYYFVTVGSANGTLLQDTANDLKTRFKRIFVLYDRDKAGLTNSTEFANTHGFMRIDPAQFYPEPQGVKDFCELWNDVVCGAKGNTQKAQAQIHERLQNLCVLRLKPFVGDAFGLGLDSAFIHHFNQYLGETNSAKSVLEFVEKHQRLMIQAPAGTGKSTIIQQIVSRLGEKFDTITVVCPTTSIGSQLANSFENVGVDVAYFDGTTNTENHTAKLWITTYDSMQKFSLERLENSLLIVDEFHQIANDYGYRSGAMRTLWSALNNPNQPALLLSATPNYFFTSNLIPALNFTPLLCYPKTTNTIHTQAFIYDANLKHAIDFILQNLPQNEGLTLLKYNDLTTLEIWANHLQNRGFTVDIFSSKGGEKYKKNNANYQTLMNTGHLKTKVDFILTTTLLEAGVSIKDPVKLVCNFDDCSAWSRNIQLATRPRLDAQTGTNSTVHFWMFYPKQKKVKEKFEIQPYKFFTEQFQTANRIAQNYIPNNAVRFSHTEKTSTDTHKQKFIYEFENKQVVDVPAILSEIYTLETQQSTPEQVLNRIQHFDQRFKIAPIQHITIPKIDALKEAFEQAREYRKTQKEAFVNLLLDADKDKVNATLIATFLRCPNKDHKQIFTNQYGKPTREERENARIFRDAHTLAFEARGKVDFCLKVFSLQQQTNPDTQNPYTFQQAVEKVANAKPKVIQTATNAHHLGKAIRKYKKDPNTLNAKDQTACKEFAAVHRVFGNLLKNQNAKRTAPKTLDALTQMLNGVFGDNGLNRKFTNRTALAYLENLYHIEMSQPRNGKKEGSKPAKRVRVYALTGIKKLS